MNFDADARPASIGEILGRAEACRLLVDVSDAAGELERDRAIGGGRASVVAG